MIRKLGEIGFAPYATAAYLANTPEADQRFISYDASLAEAPQQVALGALAAGRPFALIASTLEIQLAALRAGMGIAMLPEFMVEPGPDLARVDCEPPAPSREVWLAVHADLRNAVPIRAVAEAIEAAFRYFRNMDATTASRLDCAYWSEGSQPEKMRDFLLVHGASLVSPRHRAGSRQHIFSLARRRRPAHRDLG